MSEFSRACADCGNFAEKKKNFFSSCINKLCYSTENLLSDVKNVFNILTHFKQKDYHADG